MLTVDKVYAGYYEDIHILKDLSMQVQEQTITAIIGTNGVGKSTLLKTIYGFLTPREGSIVYNDEDISGISPYKAPKKGLTYIPQQRNVFPEMTVEENIRLGGWTFKRKTKKITKRLEENFERFSVINDRRKEKAGNLSGGMQRMVELGRALMIAPELMLVDEPAAGLAPMIARQIYDHLLSLRDDGMTVLLVDQNIRHAVKIADYLYVLAKGTNEEEGPREDFENIKEKIKGWL